MVARMGYWASLFGGYGGRDDRNRGGGGFTGLLMLIVAPIAATLIQLAISRSREYEGRCDWSSGDLEIHTRWRGLYRSLITILGASLCRLPGNSSPFYCCALAGQRRNRESLLDASSD